MLDHLYPRLPWNAGDILIAPWREIGAPWVTPAWVLDEREGVLLPIDPGATWAVAWRPTRPLWVTPHGVWESATDVAGAPAFCAMCPERDVLWGESDLDHRPTLEGEAPPDTDANGAQLIETADLAVRLYAREERGRVRFAVIVCRDQADDGSARWARLNGRSPAAALAEAHAPYLPFARRQAAIEQDDFRRLESAVARMIRDLRTTRDGSRLFRIAPGDDPVRRARTCEIGALARAWSEVRPDIACALLRTLFGAQTADGALPAYVDENGAPSEESLTRPVCAHSFRLTWNRHTQRAWFDEIAPRIRLHLESLIRQLDPDREGLPRGVRKEEALTPDQFDPALMTADLPALLAREISDLEEVANAVAVRGLDLGELPAYRDLLLKRLRDFWWSAETQSFSDRFADGRPAIRVTLSSVVPLICRELNRDESARLLGLLVNRDHLLGPAGLRAWTELPGDVAPAPVIAEHQLLMLDALAERGAHAEFDVLRAALFTALPEGRTADEQALLIALLAVPADDRFSARILSPALIWLNQRRRLVLAALAALFLLFNIGVVLYYTGKTTLTPQTVETTVGLARRLYREGNYEEAERLLRVILDSGNPHASAQVEMGNIYYRMGRLAEAEKAYREQKGPPLLQAQALHNLAVVMLDQGRTNEARAVWETLIADYAVTAPSAAARARSALRHLPPHEENKEGAARQGGRGEMPQ